MAARKEVGPLMRLRAACAAQAAPFEALAEFPHGCHAQDQ